MNVTEAVKSRRSIRSFTDQAVEKETLERVLETARRSPSGGNVQPWNAVVVTGDPLEKLVAAIQEKLPLGPKGYEIEYDIYPKGLEGTYKDRQFGIGNAMYEALEISREDKMGRMMQMAQNFRGFDAPVQIFTYTPKYMGKPQWSDLGMWLQTIMLLLREEGLDSCPQEAWSMYGQTIKDQLSIPDDHVFFCGMAIGYRNEDAVINNFNVPRASLEETIRFSGF